MTEPQGKERRRAPRPSVSQAFALVVDSSGDELSGGAFALDLSDLGARIRSKVHLQPGQLITVIPDDGAGQAIPSRVIWVDRSSAEGEAGIAFLEPLAARR